jgi:hypothetical protein
MVAAAAAKERPSQRKMRLKKRPWTRWAAWLVELENAAFLVDEADGGFAGDESEGAAGEAFRAVGRVGLLRTGCVFMRRLCHEFGGGVSLGWLTWPGKTKKLRGSVLAFSRLILQNSTVRDSPAGSFGLDP